MRVWFKLLAWVAVLAGGAGGILYGFFFDVWTVPSDDPLFSASIIPTMHPGDVVVLSRHTSVERGNLLRCADPESPGHFVVGRAVGQFGDTVDLQGEVVTIDGHRTPSPRACDTPTVVVHDPKIDDDVTLRCMVEEYGERDFNALRADSQPEGATRATVEVGKWYLVSDDRHIHLDSRDYGQVDPNLCQHIVFRIVSAAGMSDQKARFSFLW